MKESVEYQIYIGCSDVQTNDEIISEKELETTVTEFFNRKKIDFSMLLAKGGYLRDDGVFVNENTVCINIIGSLEMDMIGLGKSLSMYMNQEYVLVVKNDLDVEFC